MQVSGAQLYAREQREAILRRVASCHSIMSAIGQLRTPATAVEIRLKPDNKRRAKTVQRFWAMIWNAGICAPQSFCMNLRTVTRLIAAQRNAARPPVKPASSPKAI